MKEGIFIKSIKIKHEEILIKNLFFCILLSLFPVITASLISSINLTGLSYKIFVGVMFAVQALSMVIYFFVYTERVIEYKSILFALVFTIAPLITVFIASQKMDINYIEFINTLARFVSVFIFLCIPSRLTISKASMMKFMNYMVILGLIASFYNMAINYKGILSISNISNPYSVNFKSFYLNRNSFAQLLLFAIICNTFIWKERRSKISIFNYFVFFINLFATLSRAGIFCVLIFFIVLFLINFKNNIKTSLLIFIISIFLVIYISLNDELRNFLINMVFRVKIGTAGRSDIWITAIELLNKTNWLFGIGYINSVDVIKSMGVIHNEFHSLYLEIIVGGGILDLILHIIIFIIVIKRIQVILKNDKKIGQIYIAAFIAFLFYGVAESASFFSMGYVGTLFTIFLITVPIIYSNSFIIKKQKNVKPI